MAETDEAQGTGNREQHYLAVSYLKVWSTNPKKINRTAKVWAFDGASEPSEERIKDLCKAEWANSEKEPEREKDYFARSEPAWSDLVWKLRKGEFVHPNELAPVVFNMILTHCRNVAYENRSGVERLELLNEQAVTMALADIAGIHAGSPGMAPPDWYARIVDGVLSRWALARVDAPAHFVTSDNPFIRFYLRDPSVVFYGAPATPGFWLFAFDRTKMHVSPERLSQEDNAHLNILQAAHSSTHVFSALRLSDDEKKILNLGFKQRITRGELHDAHAVGPVVEAPPFKWLSVRPQEPADG